MKRSTEGYAQHRSSENPYRQGSYGRTRSSAKKWMIPILTRYGIKTRRQQELILLSCIALILAIWFLTPLSDYCAIWILYTVPIKSDVDLGREALVSLEYKYPRIRDQWGVDRIGRALIEAGILSNRNKHNSDEFSNIKMYKWDFGVVKAPKDVINAFALPGGIVRVTDSLLQTLQLTDGELAALIGHEIGHVLHRHSQKRAIKNHLLSTIWEAFLYEDQDGYDESFGEAVAEGLWKSASLFGELAFSRSDEYQADEAAWKAMLSLSMIFHDFIQNL